MKTTDTTNPAFATADLLAYAAEGHFPFDANAGQLILDRMRACYGRKHALRMALLEAQQEGIYEVTVKSATQTVTMIVTPNVAGYEAGEALAEQLSRELGKLNVDILRQLEDIEATVAKYGHGDIHPQDGAIHALCLPAGAPAAPARRESINGQRCPFLPA